MSQLLKDHKVVKEGEDIPTRPVCGASSSINGECSEWVSNIVDCANDAIKTKGVISCEELCGLVDDLNTRLKSEMRDLTVLWCQAWTPLLSTHL